MSSFDPGTSFRFTSLDAADREDIVLLSANANLPGAAPVTVNDLELSALGTSADLLGQWNYLGSGSDPAINLVSWRHIAVTGRDIYVRVTNKGYLFPLGHQAVVVTLAERVMIQDPTSSGWADAYIQIQRYIRVLEPVKSYPAYGQPFATNDWPFASVAVLSTVTPLLDPPNSSSAPDANPPLIPGATAPSGEDFVQAFLPTSNGEAVLWDLVATDLDGNDLHFQAPMYFFEAADSGNYVSEFDQTEVAPFVESYNSTAASNRQCDANGARLQFAPEGGGPSGATTHPVISVIFGAATTTTDPNVPTSGYTYPSPPGPADLQDSAQPCFYPVLSDTQIRVSAADTLSRGSFSDLSGDGVGVQYYPTYVVDGLTASGTPPSNPGAVYLQFTGATSGEAAPFLQFPSDAVGGLATPNGSMLGMSAIAGPVAGDATSNASAVADLAGYAADPSTHKPSSYFKQLTSDTQSSLSQLLGGLHLGDILGGFVDLPGGVPNITSSFDDDTGVLTVTYTMTASLTRFPSDLSEPAIFAPNGSGNLSLVATATVSSDGTATYNVNGSIDPFQIYLVGEGSGSYIILVPFNSMSFSAANGQKPNVAVSIGTVEFEGALTFVNALEQFLEDLGGSGLSINVTPTEVDASFSLSLPPIGCGVFSLSGIGFSTGVAIPFLGGPALATFGFASQENPFILTVCMFGGGGFLLLGLGFGGIQQIQAQFEFAGQFELDLGVASGGLTLAAGVYYSYDAAPAPGVTTLTGFVRLTGEVSVLGLISVSAELDLSLTYMSSGGQSYVEGTATLSVSVSICFFSVTVGITVHKQFAGGGGGAGSDAEMEAALRPELPTPSSPVNPIYFTDIVTDQDTWNNYVSAFGV